MEQKNSNLTNSTSSTSMDVSNDHTEAAPLLVPSDDPIPPPPPPEDEPPATISPKIVSALHQTSSSHPAAKATPNIPQTTPIGIASSASSSTNSYCTNSFFSLMNRHTVVDSYPSLPALKRKLYGLPSMVERLTLESRLKEHQGCVNCINFSWAGNLLASGSDDLQVVLWDWASGRVVKKFDTGHVANVFQVSYRFFICREGLKKKRSLYSHTHLVSLQEQH